jgi:hypothetical protein
LKKVVVTYSYDEGQWSADTEDFGIGYSHSDFETARKVITESVNFFYEDTNPEIEIVEVIPQAQNQNVI